MAQLTLPANQRRQTKIQRGNISNGTLLMLCSAVGCLCLLQNVLLALTQGGHVNEEYSSSTRRGSHSNANDLLPKVTSSLPSFDFILANMGKNPALQQQDQKSLTCEFRAYAPTQYYNMNTTNPPSFLKDTNYVFGKWPVMLLHSAEYEHAKMCIDKTEWSSKDQPTYIQYSDGTNPSVLSIARLKQEAPLVAANILYHHPSTSFLAAVANKRFPQCVYNGTPQLEGFDNLRTLLLLLDDQMQTLAQATIRVLVDHTWGLKEWVLHEVSTESDPPLEQIITILDDPRLFVYQGQVHTSFISHDWGWTDQYFSPVHIDFDHPRHFHQNDDSPHSKFWATLRASETVTLGKGRNQAILYDPDVPYAPKKANQFPNLFAVSWVDPVTVLPVVDTHPTDYEKQQRRRLRENNKKEKGLTATYSTVGTTQAHGTNGMMIRLPSIQEGQPSEYLGVAHFHRPKNYNVSIYAQFGHHYTHCFYTIQRKSMTSTDFQLTALSAEFVLPSVDSSGKAPNEDGWTMDAHIIQFVSSLEFLADTNELVIAYGINDCEASIAAITLQHVRDMLIPVEAGQEIGDFLHPLESFPNSQKFKHLSSLTPSKERVLGGVD
ncbi:expressed unknown protein [Seminavis robusta]|uniref:Uncharacterized protein n=1 Tax=Seminavis robusta TaxID=568900 RepID=A0A9N8HK39_9STRA|nr:expressed unknown protein [Seminavis robusta]|eukprot:Sro704_g190200.1 n/a (604) ;mRNA; f:7130-8941